MTIIGSFPLYLFSGISNLSLQANLLTEVPAALSHIRLTLKDAGICDLDNFLTISDKEIKEMSYSPSGPAGYIYIARLLIMTLLGLYFKQIRCNFDDFVFKKLFMLNFKLFAYFLQNYLTLLVYTV